MEEGLTLGGLLELEELFDSIPTSQTTRTAPSPTGPTSLPTLAGLPTPTPTGPTTTPTSIRSPSREEVLRALESVEVLRAGKEEWKLFFEQVKTVLTGPELQALKKKRRRALGVLYARDSRNKTKRARGDERSQFAQVAEQNQQLSAAVVELATANAQLRRQLDELRNQLGL